jgi:hypothetical protein
VQCGFQNTYGVHVYIVERTSQANWHNHHLQMGGIKLKSFNIAKEAIKSMKRQAIVWEEIQIISQVCVTVTNYLGP